MPYTPFPLSVWQIFPIIITPSILCFVHIWLARLDRLKAMAWNMPFAAGCHDRYVSPAGRGRSDEGGSVIPQIIDRSFPAPLQNSGSLGRHVWQGRHSQLGWEYQWDVYYLPLQWYWWCWAADASPLVGNQAEVWADGHITIAWTTIASPCLWCGFWVPAGFDESPLPTTLFGWQLAPIPQAGLCHYLQGAVWEGKCRTQGTPWQDRCNQKKESAKGKADSKGKAKDKDKKLKSESKKDPKCSKAENLELI